MIDGVLVIDKPPGWTSHDVVARCRRLLGQRRVGHAGTLDPAATGVLVVGAGRATRLLRFVTGLPKRYHGEVVLGRSTSTLDAEGEVTACFDMGSVTLDQVREAAAALTGRIMQVPPMVSAVRVGGRRLHELARAGAEVERQARPVTVHRLEVSPTAAPGVFAIDVSCSSGTYVRSLAADLGTALGGGAHLGSLRRLAVGGFVVERAVPLDAAGPGCVLPPAAAVEHLPHIVVDARLREAVAHGAVLAPGELGIPTPAGAPAGVPGATPPPGPWAVLDGAGTLLAVYEAVAGGPLEPGTRLKPAVVLAPLGGPAGPR